MINRSTRGEIRSLRLAIQNAAAMQQKRPSCMRAQDQNCGPFEKDQQDSPAVTNFGAIGTTQSPRTPRWLYAGEEEIIGDMISHQQRRETRIVPDHVGR